MNADYMGFLSLMVYVWGAIAVVAFTFMWRQKKWALAVGPVLGLLVNIVGQIIIAGGGPGGGVGFVAFPLYGLVISWLTLRIAGSRRQ
ncbi:MAG: hypothetical protein JW955_22910 [Sedimentisphaerales bacterium]|nr:hypothetical protein [Sedimentisphaerales bacterium]